MKPLVKINNLCGQHMDTVAQSTSREDTADVTVHKIKKITV